MEEDTLFSGESVNVEYKVAVPANSEKYMKTVVAYANEQGGKIIFGVDDKIQRNCEWHVYPVFWHNKTGTDYMLKELILEGQNRYYDCEICKELSVTQDDIERLCVKMKAVALRNTLTESEGLKVKQAQLKQEQQISLATVKRLMSDLQKRGVIKRQGSSRKGKWIILPGKE